MFNNSEYSKKKLTRVALNADAYAVCLQHALSTEKEEVMGLLIGDIDEDNGIAHISSSIILRRIDKEADRVEISDEQMLAATSYTEKLAQKSEYPLRILGWYHSHPHITVWPSHVDLNTQLLYQSIDRFFIGLIFSVFPNETRDRNYSKSNEIQLTCFQSQNITGHVDRIEIPVYIKPFEFNEINLNMMAELPKILREEEDEIALNYLTGDDPVDPLVDLHNISQRFNGMVRITMKSARPIYEVALAREAANQQKIKYMEKERDHLLKELLKQETIEM